MSDDRYFRAAELTAAILELVGQDAPKHLLFGRLLFLLLDHMPDAILEPSEN